MLSPPCEERARVVELNPRAFPKHSVLGTSYPSQDNKTQFGRVNHTCRSHTAVLHRHSQNLTDIERRTCCSFSEVGHKDEVLPRLTLLWQSVSEKDMFCKGELEALKVPISLFPLCSDGSHESLNRRCVLSPALRIRRQLERTHRIAGKAQIVPVVPMQQSMSPYVSKSTMSSLCSAEGWHGAKWCFTSGSRRGCA